MKAIDTGCWRKGRTFLRTAKFLYPASNIRQHSEMGTDLVRLHTMKCPLSNPSFRHGFSRNPKNNLDTGLRRYDARDLATHLCGVVLRCQAKNKYPMRPPPVIPACFWRESRCLKALDPRQKHVGVTGRLAFIQKPVPAGFRRGGCGNDDQATVLDAYLLTRALRGISPERCTLILTRMEFFAKGQTLNAG
jgi:hypothetical protein